jgi:hypothetical protein
MDELQRQMLEIARSVAGGARAPGPMAARRRGRQLRRRVHAVGIATIALVVGALPVARWAGIPPSSTTAAPPPSSVAPVDGLGPLTPERYLPFAPPGARWLGPIEVVASGEQSGHRWRVVAYRLTSAKGAVLTCANYEHEGIPADDDQADLWLSAPNHGCEIEPARMGWSLRASPREAMLAGIVTERAVAVRLHFADGTFTDTPTVEGSPAFAIKFFAFALPFDATRRMVAVEPLDGRGRALCAFPRHERRNSAFAIDPPHQAVGGSTDCPTSPEP